MNIELLKYSRPALVFFPFLRCTGCFPICSDYNSCCRFILHICGTVRNGMMSAFASSVLVLNIVPTLNIKSILNISLRVKFPMRFSAAFLIYYKDIFYVAKNDEFALYVLARIPRGQITAQECLSMHYEFGLCFLVKKYIYRN